MTHIETPVAPQPNAGSESRRKPALVLLAVAVLLGAGALYWFFRSDAPPEADLSATAAAVAAADNESAAAAATGTVGADGIAGSWAVDTSIGEFTVTGETTATFAGFRVDEVLSGIGSTTAVGRTPRVSGTITIEDTTVVSAQIVADLTVVESDESRRDDRIQQALGTSTNPEATFVLTEPLELGDEAATGQPVSVTAVGELTINGVTNPVEIPLEAQLVDEAVLIVGSAEIVFADYEVEAPSSPAVLSVEDHGILELQLWLSR